mmetsp:Transcript_52364/g.120364  ORF Transcript_52364/g.120364 Transcript_52364/m.120364 type:complete len:262 (-) Transcript_52364:672-1457(-)
MSGQKYKALCAEVGQLTASHSRTIDSMQKAEEKLREAIALCPNRRDAHGMIAQLMVAHSADGAAKHYLRTVELSVGRDEMWAKSVVMTFDHFLSKRHEVSGLAPPAWWTDETLKSYLSNAKELLPKCEWRAVRAHAIVLSAPVYAWVTWEVGARTADELLAAADSFQALAKLVAAARKGVYPVPLGVEDMPLLEISDSDMKCYIALALQCRRLASEGGCTADEQRKQLQLRERRREQVEQVADSTDEWIDGWMDRERKIDK